MAKQRQAQKKAENVRVPLLGSFTNRNYATTKDQRFINIFPETRKVEAIENTKIFLNKRPGLTVYKTVPTGEGRGIVYFNGKFYYVIGNTVWEDGPTPTNKITLTGSTGVVGMQVANSSIIGDYLFICDGTGGWYINTSGTATHIVDADFPNPHLPVPTFIDGYILLAKGSDIYNCVLDTPSSWDPSEFISAEMFPDPLRALARQNNQVVALGNSSIEFFYDAANVSGSPLSRNEATAIQMGTASPYAIYQNEKYCIYVSQSDSGGRAVWLIDGTTPKRVSDEFIDRILDKETNIGQVTGFGFRTMGHLFYLLNLPTLDRTLVYDTDEKLWHEWSTNTGDGLHHVFSCAHMADDGTGKAYLIDSNGGNIYYVNPQAYTDANSIIVDVYTNKYDFDTYKRKFFYSCLVVGDSYDSTNNMNIRWTDDDYKTWSAYRTVDMSDSWPSIPRLGCSRRRAFNLNHTDNLPLRLESLELTYLEGDT